MKGHNRGKNTLSSINYFELSSPTSSTETINIIESECVLEAK